MRYTVKDEFGEPGALCSDMFLGGGGREDHVSHVVYHNVTVR